MRRFSLISLAGLLLAAGAARIAGAQSAAAAGDFIYLLAGADTFSVERVTRRGATLESELLMQQAGARLQLTVDLAPTAGATRFRMEFRPATVAATSAAQQSMDARFTADSVIADIGAGGRTMTQRFATEPRALPFLNPSMALLELVVRQALAQALAAGVDSAAVPVWNAQGGETAPVTVTRLGRDSVTLTLGVAMRLAISPAGEIMGGSIPSQNIRIVRVRGAQAPGSGRDPLAVEKPDYAAPPGAPYTAEEVRITSPKGHVLAGTLTVPAGAAGRVPAIVTITGSGASDRDEALPIVKGYRPFRQVADTLARHGIAVLRLDDRGWGASTGDHSSATSVDFAEDVRTALAWLRARPEIDGRRLGLVGHSEGGLIAPMVAVEEPALRAIVLMAGPSQSGRTILDYQLRNGIAATQSLSSAQRDSALREVPRMIDSLAKASPWLRYFLVHDPLATARRVKVPTLILQGETDRQVTAPQAEELAAALRAGGNRDVTVRLFPRANHLFVEDADGAPTGYTRLPSGAVRSDVLAELIAWLTTKMR